MFVQRLDVWPITPGYAWGVTLGPWPSAVLPAGYTIRTTLVQDDGDTGIAVTIARDGQFIGLSLTGDQTAPLIVAEHHLDLVLVPNDAPQRPLNARLIVPVNSTSTPNGLIVSSGGVVATDGTCPIIVVRTVDDTIPIKVSSPQGPASGAADLTLDPSVFADGFARTSYSYALGGQTLTLTAPAITQGTGSDLNLRGATLAFGFNNSDPLIPALYVGAMKNGYVTVPAGFKVERGLRTSRPALIENMQFSAPTEIVDYAAGNSAFVRLEHPGSTIRRSKFQNLGQALILAADDCVAEKVIIDTYFRGIRFEISGSYTYSGPKNCVLDHVTIGALAGTTNIDHHDYSGKDGIGGNAGDNTRITVPNIGDATEHGIYLANKSWEITGVYTGQTDDLTYLNGWPTVVDHRPRGLVITGGFVRRSAHAGIKLRSWLGATLNGVAVKDASYNTSGASGFDGFRFEMMTDLDVTGCSVDADQQPGRSCANALVLKGCNDVRIRTFSGRLAKYGIFIQQMAKHKSPEDRPFLISNEVNVEAVLRKIVGPALYFDHALGPMGNHYFRLDVDGADQIVNWDAGSNQDGNAGDDDGGNVDPSNVWGGYGTPGTGKKITLVGTFRNITNPTVWPNDSKIDASGLFPGNADGTTVAAATTTIYHVAAEQIVVTGTTTITSLGNAPAGHTRRLRIRDGLTLTASANIITTGVGGGNLVCPAGSYVEMHSKGGSTWECTRKSNTVDTGGPLTFGAYS